MRELNFHEIFRAVQLALCYVDQDDIHQNKTGSFYIQRIGVIYRLTESPPLAQLSGPLSFSRERIHPRVFQARGAGSKWKHERVGRGSVCNHSTVRSYRVLEWPFSSLKPLVELISFDSTGSWQAPIVATYCTGRIAEHPKSNSTGGFYLGKWWPCTLI